MIAYPFGSLAPVIYSPPSRHDYFGDPPPGTRIEVRIVPDVPPAKVPATRPEEV